MKSLWVGRSVQRLDGRDKVTGRARYVYDISLQGMVHGKILRSPYPHARIKGIDTSKAEAMPGVRAVITAKDVPDVLHGDMVSDVPTLAKDVVRYLGEPVAAVAADTIERAEEALEAIRVDYEPLPALTDPEEALRPDPPVVIHPDMRRYKRRFELVELDPPRPNVTSYWKTERGDVEKAFRECDLIVENRYESGMAHTWHLEPSVCIAKPEGDGSLTVWVSAQNLHRIQEEIAECLEMEQNKIRVIVPIHVGGGFGNKSHINHLEAITAALAIRTGRPVKVAFTREEVFLATTVRHPTIITIKDGVMKDGRIVARKMVAIYNGGAYAFHGEFTARNAILAAGTVYNIPNLLLESFRVCTNLPAGGAFRGNGGPQAFWAIESQMDEIAKKLSMDPIELRLINLYREGEINALGEKVRDFHLGECLLRVHQAMSAWVPTSLPPGWVVGRGVAIGHKWSGANIRNVAIVKLLKDGRVELWTSTIELGEGTQTGFAQLVAEKLGIPIERVVVRDADSSVIPSGVGAGGSRQMYNTGNAILLAAQDLAKKIVEKAAKLLDAQEEDLELRDGYVVVRGSPERRIAFSSVAESEEEGLEGRGEFLLKTGTMRPDLGRYDTDRGNAYYAGAAIGAEVAVNAETGQVKVLRIACAADVGKALNPAIVEGQLEGGAVMGIGTTLMEEMVIVNGKVINTDLKDYRLPSAFDAPEMKHILVEVALKDGPFGAKGVGESSIMPLAPAISNAIANAIGARPKRLPITPEEVFRLIRSG